jgi:hypothetical protein
MKIRCFLARYFMALLALVSAILCILHAHRHKLMPPPSSPPAIGGNYSAGSPTAPPAIGSGYSAGSPTAPRAIGGNYSAGTPSAPPAVIGNHTPAAGLDLELSGNVFPDVTGRLLPREEFIEGKIAYSTGGFDSSGDGKAVYVDWTEAGGGKWRVTYYFNGVLNSAASFESTEDVATPAEVDTWTPVGTATGTLRAGGHPVPPACSSNYTPGSPSAPPAIS